MGWGEGTTGEGVGERTWSNGIGDSKIRGQVNERNGDFSPTELSPFGTVVPEVPLRVTIRDNAAPVMVEDATQLDQVLHAAVEEARRRNVLGAIRIEAENGNAMTMVVGSEETVLSFDYGHQKPPYYASKGTCDNVDPILTCYLTFQHHTEFPRKYVIPYADGLKAVGQFLYSGLMPACIKWAEV
jgi:hypothetical protein